jgi:hypothetical protein
MFDMREHGLAGLYCPAARRAIFNWSRRMQQDRLTRPWSLWTIPPYPPEKTGAASARWQPAVRKCALKPNRSDGRETGVPAAWASGRVPTSRERHHDSRAQLLD